MDPALIDFRQVQYLLSAHRPEQWPTGDRAEIAFAGRSNVGKSSAINAITGNKGLARTSKTPGRTRQIIFFNLDERYRLVDLPGYGYAKVPEQLKQHWKQLLEHYLRTRDNLRAVVIPMDIRHPGKPLDWQMLEWCRHCRLPVHILLTKADKLSRNKAAAAHGEMTKALLEYPSTSIQLFSASNHIGIDIARGKIIELLIKRASNRRHERHEGEASGAQEPPCIVNT